MKRKKKGIKKLKSINFSLWLNFTLFAIIIVFIMAIISILIVTSVYNDQSRDKLQSVGSTVTAYLQSPNERSLDLFLRETEYNNGVSIFIIRSNGTLIFPTYAEMEVGDVEELLTEAKDKTEDKEIGTAVIYSTDRDSMSYVECIIYNGGYSYLVINYSLDIANTTTRALATYILIICLVAILVAFIVSYFISAKLSGPINSITTTANELAKGNYDVKFASAEYSEVAQLSDTLNYVTGEIKKSDEFQKQLLANVSHDLKTPLTMIKAYASMVQEISGDDPEKRNKHLQVIIDEADRLTGLVNDVLNVSKVSADNRLNKKVFNLTDYVYGVVDKFSYLQETQDYKIMVDIDPNLYTCADEEKIGQVLYNLVSNAVNYTGEDKTIYVSLKDDTAAGRIKFSVRDTGKGIAKEDMDSIWNRFYRVKENHARPVKGTGLGLSIVKIILENHCFDFGVESEVNKGSTFWVDFPSVPETPHNLPFNNE